LSNIQNIQPGEKTKGDSSLYKNKFIKRMNILKQVLGIDVAQKELVVCLSKLNSDLSIKHYAYKVFPNNETGFLALVKWVKKLTIETVDLQFVMEATGVYHQKFAYYLDVNCFNLSIVLPNKISNYMRTLENRTITDKTCAEAIAQFGLERKLDNWKRPKITYKRLQQLTREREQIINERTVAKNQLHAENAEAEPHFNSLKRLKARIKLLNQQEKDIEKDIEVCIKQDESIANEIKNITTIPGVGRLTATIVLAETNGFELIKNKSQLVSYAGLDVREKQSGTSVNGKPRISKKGNKYLRKAMFFPAMSAVKYVPNYEELYARMVSKNGIKMKGLVAVQRKLLELIYTLFKNKTTYEKDYKKEKRALLHEVAVAL
jgi:transposase